MKYRFINENDASLEKNIRLLRLWRSVVVVFGEQFVVVRIGTLLVHYERKRETFSCVHRRCADASIINK